MPVDLAPVGTSANWSRPHDDDRRGAWQHARTGQPDDTGFTVLEVVIAFALLLAAVAGSASLLTTAITTGGNSRLKQVATDVASSVLDCAVQQGAATLLGEMSYTAASHCGGPTVTEGGQPYTVEQEVSPEVGSSCSAPQAGVANGLKVTVLVTWARVSGAWWQDPQWSGMTVRESSYAAVPAAALNSSDGEILAIVTDGHSVGEGGVTVTASLGSPPTTTVTAVTSSDGCVLFPNVTPGTWYLSASGQAGWVGTTEQATAAGVPDPVTVAAGAPTTVPIKYAPAATVTIDYTTTAGTVPANIDQLPVSFYSNSLSTDPYVPPASATRQYQVFPFAQPGYTVVAGACGALSAPDGTAVDGKSLVATDGGSPTVTFPLTPLDVVATTNGGPTVVAAVTAQPSTTSGTLDTAACTPAASTTAVGEVTLQLGSTTALAAQVTRQPGSLPRPGLVLTSLVSAWPPVATPHRRAAAPAARLAASVTIAGAVGAAGAAGGAPLRTTLAAASPLALSASAASGAPASSTTLGQPVTFNVTWSGPTAPDGSQVTIAANGTGLCTATMAGSTASCTADPPVGTDVVTASVAGTTSGTLTLTVARDPTTVTLSSDVNPAALGGPVTFTATIAPSGSPQVRPTGTVTFEDGSTPIGTASIANLGTSTATLTTTALAAGAHDVTAVYGGDVNFAGSVSGPLAEEIVVSGSSLATALPLGTFDLVATGTAGGVSYRGSTVLTISDPAGVPEISVNGGPPQAARSAVPIALAAAG